MRRMLVILATTVALMLALTLPASTVSASSSPVYVDVAHLTGAAEVPGPGDPDATGFAVILIVPEKDLVCWKLGWRGIDGTVTAAHIHGPANETQAAGVLVPLSVDPSRGCVTDSDADAIAANPTMYYVNIHSTVFPGGAIRGQLD